MNDPILAGIIHRAPDPKHSLICEGCELEFVGPDPDRVQAEAEQHQLDQEQPELHEPVAF